MVGGEIVSETPSEPAPAPEPMNVEAPQYDHIERSDKPAPEQRS